jgi:hypothetical protein
MSSNGFKSTGVPCVYQDLPWDELDDACRLRLRRDGQTPERWEQRRKTHPFFVKFTAEKKSYWAWFPTITEGQAWMASVREGRGASAAKFGGRE